MNGKVLAEDVGVVFGGRNMGLTDFCLIQPVSPKQTYHRVQLILSAELLAPL